MRNRLLLPLTLVVAVSGCATPKVAYTPALLPAQLPTAKLPKLLLEDAVDETQGGVVVREGAVQSKSTWGIDVDWAAVAQTALAAELQRLGWPTTESRAAAGARMQVTVKDAYAEWPGGGISLPVKAKVALEVVLKGPDGRQVWQADLKAPGRGTIGSGGNPFPGIAEAWNMALNQAMPRLGPMLAEEHPWTLLGPAASVAAANVAASNAPAAEAVPPSDIDHLPPQGPAQPRAFAVAVGVERYRAKLPNADFAASDARLAAEYFKRILGVPAANIAVLADEFAAKGDFEKYFERWLPNQVAAGDTVYVFYSGHGAPNPAKGDSYLVPYDGDPAYIDETGFSVKRLLDDLAKLPAKQVYLAMDSCFSGAGGRSVLAKGARPLVNVVSAEVPANVTVLAASAGDQVSGSYQEKGHGLFTYFLLKGLREKGGDLRAAFDYSKPEVSRTARTLNNTVQDPQWREGR